MKNPDEEEGLTLTPFRKDLLGSLHELGGGGGGGWGGGRAGGGGGGGGGGRNPFSP